MYHIALIEDLIISQVHPYKIVSALAPVFGYLCGFTFMWYHHIGMIWFLVHLTMKVLKGA